MEKCIKRLNKILNNNSNIEKIYTIYIDIAQLKVLILMINFFINLIQIIKKKIFHELNFREEQMCE